MDGEFVEPGSDDDGEAQDFVASSPKGVIRASGSGGSSVQGDRAAEAPQDEIENHREIAYTDPHVHEGIETIVDWVVGDGYNIAPKSFDSAMEAGVGEEAAETAQDESGGGEGDGQSSRVQRLRRLLDDSKFWKVFNQWVRYAIIDGHAFISLVVQDGTFKPTLLPTTRMRRDLDQYGNVVGYVLEPPQGAGGSTAGTSGDGNIKFAPHEVAELWFHKEPTEDFGRSMVEPISEQADMLRDMEIDYARFIATKAYPPILWKLGDEDHNWTEDQVQTWMDNVESIEPDSMLGAPHDVETEVVGTTSTSSSAGAMRLEETFQHFENRVVTGLGVPALLMNMTENSGEASATMPSFKRRIERLQNLVQEAVEQQILKSILAGDGGLESFSGTVPEFQFGEYSSAEKRLEVDKLLNLFNNGLLTPEAFAERAGLDPDEVPDMWDEQDLLPLIRSLARKGDQVQNPQGGSPTETEGGAESAGGEVTSRQSPDTDAESGRNRQSPTEDEDV